jgi:DNA polymerase-3 subunit alpha
MIVENAALLSRYNANRWEEKHSNQVSLFGGDSVSSTRPQLQDMADWPAEERLLQEYEAIGFYLSNHPLDAFREQLLQARITPIANAGDKLTEKSSKLRLAGVVTSITHRSSGARRFTYFKLSDPTGLIEISIFDDGLIARSRDLLESKKPLLVMADGRKDEGGIRLIADELKPLEMSVKKTPQQLHLVVTQAEHVSSLVPFLKTRAGGDARLTLTLKLNNASEISCELPERFALHANELEPFGAVC